MVLADSERARPLRTEQDRKAKPRGTNPNEGTRPPPEARLTRGAPTESPSKAGEANNRFARGVEWQVPGLRPPAYRRLP